MNQMMIKLSVLLPQSQSPPLPFSRECSEPRRNKKKKSALMELMGNKFQSENDQTTDTATFKDIVHSELLHHKSDLLYQWIILHFTGGLSINTCIQM